MAPVVLLLLLLTAWGDFRPEGPPAAPGPAPKTSQRREALEEFEGLLTVWQRERSEYAREVLLQERADARLEADRLLAAEPKPAPSKSIEVKRKAGKGGRGKVIELPAKDKLEAELEEAEADADARRAACKKDPSRCVAEKMKREKLEAADEAFDSAIEAGFEKRRAAIEAEGARMKAELDAARAREANRQAKKLGGSVDEEGNFVDDELKAEPPPRKPE